ncbi:ATP-dependent helicase [Oerskovia sp. Sa4CUA1]|uniref:DNA 3'-5' helicase n=1 Tax=Oerskovia rustica TaxID=2762237 RepID=A0ABR8RR62_9CELL|nr:UrvD/REP family ATP-dependent DNA helicase [Oerskovia rustica]MBD7950255.1 ATP-dependent helicase [Oerskovia rustica]
MLHLPDLRLVLPDTASAGPVRLDETQRAALDAARTEPATLVVGAPGTGKTTVAIEVAAQALSEGVDPARILVVAASRRSAAEVRDRLSARADRTVSAPMVRTAAAAAFAVLRARAAATGEPPPTLISGPEQDLLLAELLAGHLDGEGVPLRLPDGLPEEVLALRGLRQELRDLLMRAAERGLTPADLDDLGAQHDRPEWRTAAQVYQEYLDVTALRVGTPDLGSRYDPAVVVDEAAEALLAWEDEVTGAPRPGWDLVVVDDYQEATIATARFLRVVHDDGARLVLLADPDTAVQTFRGASPALVGRAAAPVRRRAATGEFDARVEVLGTAWRQEGDLRAVTRTVTTQIGTVAGAVHRGAAASPVHVPEDGPPRGASVALLGSGAEEAAYVARELRAEHLLHGTPWGRMAVVCRAGAQLATLRRALVAASVPVGILGSDVPLREEPAVTPLLAIMRVAVGLPPAGYSRGLDGVRGAAGIDDAVTRDVGDPAETLIEREPAASDDPSGFDELDPVTAAALVTSPVGGLDVVALRRLRRALRAEELGSGGGRTSDALLVEVLLDESRAATLPTSVRRGAVSVARVIAAGRESTRAPDATAQTVLWAIWSATGLSDRWRDAALGGGAVGARADRDLDAVLALFRAAETFVDRMPGAPPSAFVEYLESQDLPADSLAARATGTDSVAALTPAGAAGREWDVVVVAGVQDGVWPDLRLRDSLLGSEALVELLAGRSQDAHGLGPDARRTVLTDELRSFAVATSRATRRLLVTAVSDVDEVPSPFVDLVCPPAGPDDDAPTASGTPDDGDGPVAPDEERDPRRVEVGQPLDLRGLVASARSLLVEQVVREVPVTSSAAGRRAARGGRRDRTDVPDPERADALAELLADLALAGVGEARPESWYGVNPVSSTEPLWGSEDTVLISPSKVESVSRCALRWAVESAGGTAPDATAQSLGNLVHSIAQEAPRGTRSELAAELDRRWPELALTPGWPATQTRHKAEDMIGRLAGYLQSSGEPLLVEAPFELEIGRAVLRGVIDRVEDAGDGAVRVADLKTGKTKPSVTEAVTNPQLGTYQLAVEGGVLDLPEGTRSAGAQLVFVGDGKDAGLRTQPALEPEPDGSSWARELVEDVADTMADSVFTARENKLCSVCPVRRSCPLMTEGRQVIA